jgi:hypothetical protein
MALSIIKHHAIKTYVGMEVQLHVFLISVLDAGEWSSSRFSGFTPWNTAPDTHCIGQWYSTWDTRTPGGTGRHLRGYVKFKIYIL